MYIRWWCLRHRRKRNTLIVTIKRKKDITHNCIFCFCFCCCCCWCCCCCCCHYCCLFKKQTKTFYSQFFCCCWYCCCLSNLEVPKRVSNTIQIFFPWDVIFARKLVSKIEPIVLIEIFVLSSFLRNFFVIINYAQMCIIHARKCVCEIEPDV